MENLDPLVVANLDVTLSAATVKEVAGEKFKDNIHYGRLLSIH